MNGSITGCALDEASGKRLTSPDVRLYRIGVVGEILAVLDEHGCFSFSDLSPGEYSLAVYAPRYVTRYERLTLKQDETIHDLQISLMLGGYISGRVVDGEGQPPQRCWFTLLREGERDGRFGFINDSGDHQVEKDGTFCSPPLAPGKYVLRFAGMLRESLSAQDTSEPRHRLMQKRFFDFLYPDAHDVTKASELSVHTGQKAPELQITITRPIWYTVRGKVTGPLPEERSHISVMFARDVGAVDQIGGGSGAQVQPDGSFEYMAQRGRYSAEVCEFTPPGPTGKTHLVRRFGTGTITVAYEDLSGLEITVSSEDQS